MEFAHPPCGGEGGVSQTTNEGKDGRMGALTAAAAAAAAAADGLRDLCRPMQQGKSVASSPSMVDDDDGCRLATCNPTR